VSKTYTTTKENLVLFLENNLDLNNEIFIDDLENFPDKKHNKENLLLETNKILENINKETSHILEQDNYNDNNWDSN
ncbi:20890_t:CDS:1, partial [Dentiscutata erythropus]